MSESSHATTTRARARWHLLAWVMLAAAWIPLPAWFDASGQTLDGMLPADEWARTRELRRSFESSASWMLVWLEAGLDSAELDSALRDLTGDERPVRAAYRPWSRSRLDALIERLRRVDGVAGIEEVRIEGARSRASRATPDDDDGRVPNLLLLRLAERTLELEHARALCTRLEAELARAAGPRDRTAYVGPARLRADSWSATRSDVLLLLPLLALIAVGLPRLVVGSWRAGWLVLGCAGATSASSFWAIALVEGRIAAQFVLILPILWAAASLDALHVATRLARPISRRLPLRRSLRPLARPCVATTLTTAAGLASIGLGGDVRLLASLGRWAAFGVLMALPWTLAWTPLVYPPAARGRRAARGARRFALRLDGFARRRSHLVLGTSIALTIAAGWLATWVRVSSDYPRVFAADLAIARDADLLAERLGSDLAPIDVIVAPADERAEGDLLALAHAALALGRELRSLDEFRASWPSLEAFVDVARGATGSSAPPDGSAERGELDRPRVDLEAGRGPTPAGSAAELSAPFASEARARAALAAFAARPEARSFFDPRTTRLRLQLHLAPTSFAERSALFERLRYFDRTMLGRHRLEFAGAGWARTEVERVGLRDLVGSAEWTLVALAGLLTITLRSVSAMLRALVASLLPLLWVAGALGAFGLTWTIALLPLPGALLGVAVDDSIHLLEAGGSRRAIARLAPALVGSTGLLAACVLSLSFTSLRTNREFGRLMAFGLVAALLLDLCLLPLLAGRARTRTGEGAKAAHSPAR